MAEWFIQDGPLPVKVAPARETPATPATLAAVRERGEGGLQALALEVDETHPAGQNLPGGLWTESPWQEEL